MKNLRILSDISESEKQVEKKSTLLTVNDNICHLFKRGLNPVKFSLKILTTPDTKFFKLHHNVQNFTKYKNSVELSNIICNLDMNKILTTIIDCFLKRYCKKKTLLCVLSNSILENIVWDKYPFKINFIKPINSSFEPLADAMLITVPNSFPNRYHYYMTTAFINYYNNVMSGKSKMPAQLLNLKDVQFLIYLRNNLKPVKGN